MIVNDGAGAAPPTSLVSPVSPQETAKHIWTEEAKARANSDPLPGPVAMAFDDRGYINVEGLEVRPVVAYDFVIIKSLNLSIHQYILELAKAPHLREEIDWNMDEQFLLCWMFTRPCAQVRAMFRRGKEAMQEAAFAEIADKMHPLAVDKVSQAVQQQFAKSILTAVEYGTGESDEKKTQFFPVAGGIPPMASAGGSAT